MAPLIQLGRELFANPEETIISWKGESYYKACGAFVANLGGSAESTCVKRTGHPGNLHEDFAGRTRKHGRGEPDYRPHSRACGVVPHEHGAPCNYNCPTCHGEEQDSDV